MPPDVAVALTVPVPGLTVIGLPTAVRLEFCARPISVPVSAMAPPYTEVSMTAVPGVYLPIQLYYLRLNILEIRVIDKMLPLVTTHEMRKIDSNCTSGDAEIGLPGRAYFRRGPALAMHAGLGMRFD